VKLTIYIPSSGEAKRRRGAVPQLPSTSSWRGVNLAITECGEYSAIYIQNLKKGLRIVNCREVVANGKILQNEDDKDEICSRNGGNEKCVHSLGQEAGGHSQGDL
jgi:hypothetical protein